MNGFGKKAVILDPDIRAFSYIGQGYNIAHPDLWRQDAPQ